MKRLLITILTFTCLGVFGQVEFSRGMNLGGDKGVKFIKKINNAFLVFNEDSFNFVTNKYVDKTTNKNDFDLVNSNALKLNGISYLILMQDTAYIPFNRNFIVEFYSSLNQPTWGMICGGLTSSHYLGMQNTGMKFNTPTTNMVFSGIQTPSDDIIRFYRIQIKTDSITVTNVTDGISEKKLNIFGNDSIGIKRIGSRLSTGILNGYIFALNLNNEHYWPLAEGYQSYCYDVITGYYAQIQTPVDSLRVKQNLYHYNLRYGYSNFYNSPTKQIKVPMKLNGDTLNVAIAFYTHTGNFPGGKWFNNAETGIKPPLVLKPYDCNNFLFDISGQQRIIYYENFTENCGNKIFMNVSTPYKYKQLRIYNKPLL